jgi:hypothetical protein
MDEHERRLTERPTDAVSGLPLYHLLGLDFSDRREGCDVLRPWASLDVASWSHRAALTERTERRGQAARECRQLRAAGADGRPASRLRGGTGLEHCALWRRSAVRSAGNRSPSTRFLRAARRGMAAARGAEPATPRHSGSISDSLKVEDEEPRPEVEGRGALPRSAGASLGPPSGRSRLGSRDCKRQSRRDA